MWLTWIPCAATGCVWFWVGGDEGDTNGWISQQEWDDDIPTTTKWLRSFYWSITTITTVGYGDISAATTKEMIFTAFQMCLGMILNAFVVGWVSKAIANSSVVEDEHAERIAHVREYMRSKRVPAALQKEVLAFQNCAFEQERNFDVHEFLEELPPAINMRMLDFLYIRELRRIECFSEMPEQILVKLSGCIMQFPIRNGQLLFRAGDVAREAFLIHKGVNGVPAKVRLDPFRLKDGLDEDVDETDRASWELDTSKKFIELEDGDIFGLNALDFDDADVVRDLRATATTDGELWLLPADAVQAVHEQHPDAGLREKVLQFRAKRGEEFATGRVRPTLPGPNPNASLSASVTPVMTTSLREQPLRQVRLNRCLGLHAPISARIGADRSRAVPFGGRLPGSTPMTC